MLSIIPLFQIAQQHFDTAVDFILQTIHLREEILVGQFASLPKTTRLDLTSQVVEQMLEKANASNLYVVKSKKCAIRLSKKTWARYCQAFEATPPHIITIAAFTLAAGIDCYKDNSAPFFFALDKILTNIFKNNKRFIFSPIDFQLIAAAQKAYEKESLRLKGVPNTLSLLPK